MKVDHHYRVAVEWSGNTGTGTSGYRDYLRDGVLAADTNHVILSSADRPFRGTGGRWNPEQLLLAALAQCHMLSYLHVAVRHGLTVVDYRDDATAALQQQGDGGHLTEAVLHPRVTITGGDPLLAQSLHAEASALCFIASSVNFPVRHEPVVVVRD